MKKIIIIAIMLLACLSATYAADKDWDCLLVLWRNSILSSRDENIVLTGLVSSMPKEAMEKAFDNLNKYCCDAKIISSNCNTTNDKTLYPESIYIFDHILDIYLRRLDAKVENDNWKNLMYNLTADWSGQEWRDYITECGNDINWRQPLEIKTKYEAYWTWSKNIASFIDNDTKTKEDWTSSIKAHIDRYEDWTLRDKYNLACDVVNYIVENKPIDWKWLTQSEYKLCKDLTNARIDREYTYVQTIMMQKANELLWSNVNSYISDYFVYDKLSNLQQIMFDINTSFSEINDGVTKLIPQCS